jgi:iron(III) transport system permease protein
MTAFALVFLTTATELTMSVMLLPPGTDLLGTLLFELTTYADPTAASVLACAFVALVVAGLGVLGLARRPRSSEAM